MIRLEDPDDTVWGKNFNRQVSRKSKWTDYRHWHMVRRKMLSEYNGKISRAGGKISFVFEDDKHATWFIMKWT